MAAAKTYSIHCLIAFIGLSFPLLRGFLKADSTPDLTGQVISAEKPEFSREAWLDGSYQRARDDYNHDHWAFRESTVRLNNQFYYKAFNQIRVKNFVLGKEDYVYSEDYIFSAFGDDLMPESRVEGLLRKARVIQDTLKAKGIDLLLVYAPGKGAACREFIQDKYVHPYTTTNHDLFVKHSRKLALNHLDLFTWFEKLKPVAAYPLFPRFGHHWSYYGECLAVDTIIHHIERLHGTDMPEFEWSSIEVSDTARSRDADVLRSMNLWKDPEQNMKLAYPVIGVENDPAKNSTKVLTISDSYWYGPVYMGVPQSCFAGGQFWYYFNKVVPAPQGQKVEVWELDLRAEIESNQVIMILYSDGNLPRFSSGFIDEVYEMYTSPAAYKIRKERERQIQTYAKQVRDVPALLKKATRNSESLQIPLDSAIRLDAMRMAGFIK